jgi:FkbM family methyltransferase
LVDAALVAPAGEIGVEEYGDAGPGHVATNQPCAKGEDVGVVMLTRKLGRQRIGDPGAAARRVAVDGDRDADTRSADDDPAFGLAAGNGVCQAHPKFGIVDALMTIGAKVGDVVACLPQPSDKLVLEVHSGMVGGEGDAHGEPLGHASEIRQPVALTCIEPVSLKQAVSDDAGWETPEMRQRRLGLSLRALYLVARQSLIPGKKLPITSLGGVFAALPADFRLVVADIGSIGGLHRRWRSLAPHLITINFDPLDKRLGTERELIFHALAGAHAGSATLKVTRRASMSSTLDPKREFYQPFWNKATDVEVTETVDAPVMTLDEIASDKGLTPDALKIDVQGGEAGVLDGAADVLARSVLLAEIECSFAERYEGQQTFDQIMARMRHAGFALLDVRRLKRYRYRNQRSVDDPSLGRGMRAGRLAFCDAIFVLEPELLWQRIESGAADGANLGLKAIVLSLVYGKADLAAATFDKVRDRLPPATSQAFEAFFRSLSGEGNSAVLLHNVFDRWSQRV